MMSDDNGGGLFSAARGSTLRQVLGGIVVAVVVVSCCVALFRGCGAEPKNMLSPKAKKAAARQFKREGVTLTIQEPIGLERKAEPVTSGVPLPEGCVRKVSRLCLFDAAKKSVPCQFTPQCLWSDGTVKWVLLDFQADVGASNKVEYSLTAKGRGTSSACPVKTDINGGAAALETGNLKLGIVTNVAGLIHSIVLDGKEIVCPTNPVQVVMVDGSNRVYRASKPTEVKVEQQGPMRTTVRVSGHFVGESGATICDGKVGYDLRITAYAGKPYVKLDFTLKNDGWYGYRNEHKKREWLYLKSLRLDVPAAVSGAREVEFGGKRFAVAPGQGVDLTQWYMYPLGHPRGFLDIVFTNMPPHVVAAKMEQKIPGGFHYTWTVSDRLEGAEGKAPGWAALSGSGAPPVGLAVRRFWQNFPMGFSVAAGGEPADAERRTPRIHLRQGYGGQGGECPAHNGVGGLSFVMFPEGECWPRTRQAYDASTYQFEGGRRKTATVLLTLGTDGPARDRALALLDAPLFARASAEWYRDTSAVLPLGLGNPGLADKEQVEAMERYDRLQRAKVNVAYGDPAGVHAFWKRDKWGKVSIPSLWERCPDAFCGWMNYGDLIWAFGYCSLYYEWPYTMLQQYLRLGDREFLDVGEDMIRHRYDIDQYHVEKTEPYLGGFQRYEKGEHGDLTRQVHTPSWEKNANPSHTWNRDLLLHWALTGDPRSRDAAEQNGRAYDRFFRSIRNWDRTNCVEIGEFRVPAWGIENNLALYEYTGGTQWLARAEAIFDKTLLAMERNHGSKGHILKDGKQGAQFTGYMVEPVCRLHHLTGRRDAIEFLRRVLDWQRQAGTVRGDEKDGEYFPIMWRENWEYDPTPDEEISIGVGNSYDYPMLDGYAYLYQVLGRQEDLEFSRRLFREAMFYIMTDRVPDRRYRSPLGYHHLADIFGFTPKLRAWDGRYGQIYLYVEEEAVKR